MKWVFYVLAVVMILGFLRSCKGERASESKISSVEDEDILVYGLTRVRAFKYDGCTYIVLIGPEKSDLIHHANCKNHGE